MIQQKKFIHAIETHNFELVEILLKDNNVNPTVYCDWALIYSASNGLLEITRLLLNDGRIFPSSDSNRAIVMAYHERRYEIVDLLWSDKRVQNTLKKEDLKFYDKLKKQYLKNNIIQF